MHNLKILSMNCRGLASKGKRLDLFMKWRKEKYDIILIQDTHWSRETIIQVKEEWGAKTINSTFSTNARGTSILINKNLEYTLGMINIDPDGNYVLIEINLPNDLSLIIGSVYGPNEDKPSFYENLNKLINDIGNPNIILGGDWNSTRDFKIDNNNYKKLNNPKITQEITKLMNTYNLIDIWREKNPNTRRYTWLQGVSNKQARLDYFLCNQELISIITGEDILYKYRSDHAPIVMTIILNDQKRGPGAWKFNNKLLLDKEFIKLIKTEIRVFKQIHAATPYSPNYVTGMSKSLQFMVKPTTLWETLLCTLRGTIIKYSKQKSRGNRDKTKNLEEKIRILDKEISTGKANIDSLKKLKDLNDKLIEIKNEELKGALIRSRAEWLDLGKKPSRFFLNLENRNRVNKMISEIKLDDNTIIKNQMSILDELRKFYEKLYSEHKQEEIASNIKLENKKLSEEAKEKLETPISKKELDDALKSLKNNKAPGPDGYSAEFY